LARIEKLDFSKEYQEIKNKEKDKLQSKINKKVEKKLKKRGLLSV
jgi:hypothetical protein